MLQEDKKLKYCLVLQSFCPLFILVFIQHVGHGKMYISLFKHLFHHEWSEIIVIMKSPVVGDMIITAICVIWFIATCIVAHGFQDIQRGDYDSYGEKIIVKAERKDSGVTFLVTFLLPLLINDVSSLRGFILFVALLFMVVYLLVHSDLFYQNPVLVALKYSAYEFQFVTPHNDVKENKTYVGISRNGIPDEKAIIKRKYIADNVFLVYND